MFQVIPPTRHLGRVCACSSSRTEVLNLSLWTPRGFPEPPETECKVYMCTHACEMLIWAEASNFHSIPNGTSDSLQPQPMFTIPKLLSFETMDIWGWNSSLFFFCQVIIHEFIYSLVLQAFIYRTLCIERKLTITEYLPRVK